MDASIRIFMAIGSSDVVSPAIRRRERMSQQLRFLRSKSGDFALPF
jgi:hypothetical protein